MRSGSLRYEAISQINSVGRVARKLDMMAFDECDFL